MLFMSCNKQEDPSMYQPTTLYRNHLDLTFDTTKLAGIMMVERYAHKIELIFYVYTIQSYNGRQYAFVKQTKYTKAISYKQ